MLACHMTWSQEKEDTAHCRPILWIKCSINLIEQVEWCGVASLNCKNECQSHHCFLAPWKLLHWLGLSLSGKGHLLNAQQTIRSRSESSQNIRIELYITRHITNGNCRYRFLTLTLTPTYFSSLASWSLGGPSSGSSSPSSSGCREITQW